MEIQDVDVNAGNEYGRTALHEAVHCGNVETVKRLLERKDVHVNARNENGWTALHFAVCRGKVETVKRLLERKDVDVNAKNVDGLTALHFAVYSGEVVTGIGFLERMCSDVDDNVSDDEYSLYLALHRRYRFGLEPNVDIVKTFLARKDVDVNAVDRCGQSVLCFAFGRGSLYVIKALLARNDLDVNNRYQDEMSALRLAVETREVKIVRAVLERKDLDVGYKYLDYANLLVHAFHDNDVDIIKAILERMDVDVNVKDNLSNSLLHLAIRKGNVDMVKAIMLRNDVDMNAKDSSNLTPLILAVGEDNILIVRILVRYEGTELLDEDENGQNALEIIFSKSPKFMKILTEQPAAKEYVESLYKDRQVYVDAANAILVGAALIASVTFASWLQPPLGYSSTYNGGNYVSIDHHKSLEAFWVFNSLSFFFAIATVVFGARSVLPNRKTYMKYAVQKIRQNLLITSVLLSISVIFVIIAFGLAGYVVLPPIKKFQVNIIGTVVTGGLVCFVSLFFLAKAIHDEWTAP